ncbi:hypothetical protein JCM31826_07660 [Thermaurantimonas aggregans]|uniref:YopX protein domain-containing protein n=1 Tax=Thermaurantimonas aggregans TaxID=2173829 RepID=A0A401XJX1_9FLAO|nr:YopX family protein [Thermaurantimonas aggregans]MCX8148900.1 YopX family protein [Thermaurantimonas aggregans]GCD77284.1 hypothetical protein JCM31826_07660 [Thermaurantimonas aggregans]
MFGEKRYRLRIDDKIVGYKRVMSESYEFYSRNGLWWSGHQLYYKQIDEYSGLKDRNNQHLYELDIVEYRIDTGIERKGVILWNTKDKCFCIKDLEDTGYLPICVDDVYLFSSKDLKFHSYLFINPEIMERLGIKDE